ncbi:MULTISPECIES: hypothetical protein [unclassified Mesorhizobium]|uniref:hypothetical protein n=1 Tax=unclassified Mesorhizobium TaxID=325217 RepID=UPI0011286540|nr:MULTISPECIES: hypothetical protein [unclassified Mesorhizobium]MCA0027355.1 hypothetical protein [Mesorhizobium sp. B263B1A]TPJ98630.1 hypothetical protein FJ489_06795 [Mesorhizobium sp. B2-5-12]TPK28792.1 hypothetical protein FJ562_00185 [Mesorhizobium sp. B2-5-6]
MTSAVQQLSLFDAMHRPPVIMPVDPDGAVLQTDPDLVFVLPHKRMAWDQATIELHRHDNGLWMWSTSVHCDSGGSGYRVGAKWGKFAESKADALYYAVREIEGRLERFDTPTAALILSWARGLAA